MKALERAYTVQKLGRKLYIWKESIQCKQSGRTKITIDNHEPYSTSVPFSVHIKWMSGTKSNKRNAEQKSVLSRMVDVQQMRSPAWRTFELKVQNS